MQLLVIVLIFSATAMFFIATHLNNERYKAQNERRKCEEAKKQEWYTQFSNDLNDILQVQRQRDFEHKLIKLNYMDQIDHYEFEGFVANVLNQNGYQVQTTAMTVDGGKDLEGFSPSNKKLYGEVKHYREGNVVGRPILQTLIGAGQTANIEEYVFITTSSYTADALEYAREINNHTPFRLIDGEEFHQMVVELKERTIQDGRSVPLNT